MGRAKRARVGDKIVMIAGEYDGERGVALDNGENLNFIRVRLTTGPKSGKTVRVMTGNYVVGG